MIRFLLIIVVFFIGSVACEASGGITKPQSRSDRAAITIEILPAGLGEEHPHVYPLGKRMTIRCVIRNKGLRPKRFPLKDHDAYFGTLPYPIEAQIRVLRDNGEVITANDIDRSGEGWWTQFSVWSTTFEPVMPGDSVLIPPGGEVVRMIPIDQMLLMSPRARSGLSEGTYSIQLRINGVVSNAVTITVGTI